MDLKLLLATRRRELKLLQKKEDGLQEHLPSHGQGVPHDFGQQFSSKVAPDCPRCSCDSFVPFQPPPPSPQLVAVAAEDNPPPPPDHNGADRIACRRHARFDIVSNSSAWWTLCAAPMVGASDLPFRLMCRKYGASACYSPMLYSDAVVRDPAYLLQMLVCSRQDSTRFASFASSADRPLVVQLAANDPETAARAARLVATRVHGLDAIDLNLGCPQREARRDTYGSFLLSEHQNRQTALAVVSAVADALAAWGIPVLVKIRLLDLLPDTLELCRQLQAAGAGLICVHARRQGDVRNRRQGPPILHEVRAIVEDPSIWVPIIVNGGIRRWTDIQRHLAATGAAGVMVGEGLLADPSLFAPALLLEHGRGDPSPPASASSADSSGDPQDPSCCLCRDERLQVARILAGGLQLHHRQHAEQQSAPSDGVGGRKRTARQRLDQEALANGRRHPNAEEDGGPAVVFYGADSPPQDVLAVQSPEPLPQPRYHRRRPSLQRCLLNSVGLALEYLWWVQEVQPELPACFVRKHLKHIADEALWRSRLKDHLLECPSLLEMRNCLVECWQRLCGHADGSSGSSSSHHSVADPAVNVGKLHRRRQRLEKQELTQAGWIRPPGLSRFCRLHNRWSVVAAPHLRGDNQEAASATTTPSPSPERPPLP